MATTPNIILAEKVENKFRVVFSGADPLSPGTPFSTANYHEYVASIKSAKAGYSASFSVSVISSSTLELTLAYEDASFPLCDGGTFGMVQPVNACACDIVANRKDTSKPARLCAFTAQFSPTVSTPATN